MFNTKKDQLYFLLLSNFLIMLQFYNLKKLLKNKLPFEYYCNVSSAIPVKIWLAPEKTQKQILYNTFLQGCKANSTFSYRLYM